MTTKNKSLILVSEEERMVDFISNVEIYIDLVVGFIPDGNKKRSVLLIFKDPTNTRMQTDGHETPDHNFT